MLFNSLSYRPIPFAEPTLLALAESGMKAWFPQGLNLPDEVMPMALRRYLEKLYLDAWSAYANAGCPFGMQDEAMLIWFESGQHTGNN